MDSGLGRANIYVLGEKHQCNLQKQLCVPHIDMWFDLAAKLRKRARTRRTVPTLANCRRPKV